MRCKYPANDLNQRLDSTIIRYKGHPYYCRYDGGTQLGLYTLERKYKFVTNVNSDDPDLDISSVPLGYVQFKEDEVLYLERRPVRLYKQGLHTSCINTIYIPYVKRNPSTFHLIDGSVQDMILGRYPSLKLSIARIKQKKEYCEIAISRDIAITWNPSLRIITVFYKTKEVGFIVDGTNKVIIPSGEMAWIVSKFLDGYGWEIE